jgi:hypothetical protein
LAFTWLKDHGLEASTGAGDCRACHEPQTCDDCHQGTGIFGARGSPHPPGWKFNHFAEADFGAECLSCHETRETCTNCHRAMMRLPHPLGPAWANPATGGEHKGEFGASPEACLSCHDLGAKDPVCARCHK